MTSKFKQFWLSIPTQERVLFAHRCGYSSDSMNMVAHGRPCSCDMALHIEIESHGIVTLGDMLPEFAALLSRAGYKKARTKHRAKNGRA